MDSDLSSPTHESNELKAEFRKITNEAATRKYRRRSPVCGSSEEDGSPNREDSSRGISKSSNNGRRNDDNGDDRSSSRSQHGRNGDFNRPSRGNRHDDHSRYGKHIDEDDRSHAKSSVWSGRESRGSINSDHRERESEYRSRDSCRDADRYPRDRSDRNRYDGRHGVRYDDRDRHSRDRDHYRDEKREYRNSKDHRGDLATSKKETRDMKDFEVSKFNQEKVNIEGLGKHEDKLGRAERSKDRSGFVSENFSAKRPKFSLGGDDRKDENQPSGFKQSEVLATKVSPEQGLVSGDDSVPSVDAAKVAAIKAAQIVNQNLTSTGFMTADQKKKLLWGNKKSNATEEGVKGEVKVDTKTPSGQDAEKQRELQMDLEKQYTAGLRRRDGRTVGLGL